MRTDEPVAAAACVAMVHATAISETANIYTRDRATVRTARWVCAEDDSHPSGGKFGDDILNRTLASPAMGHWGTSPPPTSNNLFLCFALQL